MVDTATHFCAASFRKFQFTVETWRTILSSRILVYYGPQDFVLVDQGSGFISREIREILEAVGITIREAPIETPGGIGTVKSYHAPLRYAYVKTSTEMPREYSDRECL